MNDPVPARTARRPSLLSSFPFVAVSVAAFWACSPANEPARDAVALGHHLVHEVAMCVDCHSPRDATGAFDESRHLSGSPLPFQPTVAMPWAAVAPPIGGATFPAAHLETLLTTGTRPDGTAPRPPMPAFHFTPSEARAVVAYLATLRPGA